jgi:23S rRNA (uridine2552-2'-O)-methyltransferase
MYRKDRNKEFFTEKAQKEGYPARSVYKLKQIDRDFGIINKGDSVLDLGSAPGSWLMYLSEKVGSNGLVIGADIEELDIDLKENIVFLQKSIEDESFFEAVKDRKFNSVVADLSPKTTGVKLIDSGLSLELAERAFYVATKTLKPNGNFVCKLFESHEVDAFIKEIGKYFKMVKRFRPRAVISQSKEFYIVAKGFTTAL